MTDTTHSDSRRGFLSSTGKLALAATAAAGAAHLADQPATAETQMASSGTGPKKIIPGSPSPTYSRAVKLDRLVFVSGCVGTYQKGKETKIDADFASQARRTLQNLKASVEASGSSMGRVLKCTCFLKELKDFSEFNKAYLGFFSASPPARSTVIVKDLVVPDALLEVDCVCFTDLDHRW